MSAGCLAALGHPGQHCAVIVVLATTEEGLPEAGARLRELGVTEADVVAPSDARRLLLAPVDDESEGAALVARLRADGRLAVLRPGGGPALGAWMRHTRPVAISARLSLYFAWSEHNRRDLSGVVEFDPNGGFGNGQHPSTRLLLEELAGRLTGGERVLDVGCGSGVLGLSALRLGAASAVAVDIEARRDRGDATQRRLERLRATHGREARCTGCDRGVLRRRRGEHRVGDTRRAGGRARRARVARRVAGGERDLARPLPTRRCVAPTAPGARVPHERRVVGPRSRASTLRRVAGVVRPGRVGLRQHR